MKLAKKDIVLIIAERDGYLCFLCSKPFNQKESPTLDHWYPKSLGGSDELSNLRLAHKTCNTRKSDSIPNEDGTIPVRPPKVRSETRRKIKKNLQKKVCHHCSNGRKLLNGESCKNCGSLAGPSRAPHYLKKKANECDHSSYWCWACSIGIVERQSTLMGLIVGEQSNRSNF